MKGYFAKNTEPKEFLKNLESIITNSTKKEMN